MPIQIIRNDITELNCDAIVNAANSALHGGGGADGAIHKVAGKGLLLERMKPGDCKVGQTKLTGAHKLPCRYVIHTVVPKWKGDKNGEKELLESCYRESLRLALGNGCESVAFPLISGGVYGYPKDQALKVAVDCITAFLIEHDMLVYIVVCDNSAFQISEKLFTDIAAFIDDKYVDTHFEFNRTRREARDKSTLLAETRILSDERTTGKLSTPTAPYPRAFTMSTATSLEDAVKQIDESFSEMLLRKIDEKGMTDSQCYKKANVDRRLLSKIRGDSYYHPSKATAIAFAMALELSLEETKDMLLKAGFALLHSNKFDIIIEYFITNKNYNIFEINEALFAFDQNILGG